MGDEVLTKLGAINTEEKPDPMATLRKFMKQVRPENKDKYCGIQRLIEDIAQKKPEDRPITEDPLAAAQKSCETVLVEYLWDLGARVTEKFLMVLIVFIRLYRDCMNVHGWDIVKKAGTTELEQEKGKRDFASLPTAEHIPEACNDFIRYFLPREFPAFDKGLAIEMTRHLCDWVHTHKYTHKLISPL